MEDATSKNPQEINEQNTEHKSHKKGGIHNNALFAAGMGRAATAAVNPHDTSSLAQTGTNASYEGPTSLNAGGTAGAGFSAVQGTKDTLGQTNSDFLNAGIGAGKEAKTNDATKAKDAEDEINEQR